MNGGENTALRTAARRRAATERILEGQRDRPVFRTMEQERQEKLREERLVGGENIVRLGEDCLDIPPPAAHLRLEDLPGYDSRRPSAV